MTLSLTLSLKKDALLVRCARLEKTVTPALANGKTTIVVIFGGGMSDQFMQSAFAQMQRTHTDFAPRQIQIVALYRPIQNAPTWKHYFTSNPPVPKFVIHTLDKAGKELWSYKMLPQEEPQLLTPQMLLLQPNGKVSKEQIGWKDIKTKDIATDPWLYSLAAQWLTP